MPHARGKPPSNQDEREEIPPEDWKEAEFDFENNRIITKDGRIYENVQIDRNALLRWLKEKYAH